MTGGTSASPWSVLRSRRPQDTPRNFMHENRETSEMPVGYETGRPAGEGDSPTARMHVSEGSDSGIVPMNHLNKDGKPFAESEEGRPLIKENTHQSYLYAPDTERGSCIPRVGECAESRPVSRVSLRRQVSEIRAVCANERPYGSVRGVPGNWYPYRDQIPSPKWAFSVNRQGMALKHFHNCCIANLRSRDRPPGLSRQAGRLSLPSRNSTAIMKLV